MGTIALLPCDIKSRGTYLSNRDLPSNYMCDFTLMGFVVDRYHEALSLLHQLATGWKNWKEEQISALTTRYVSQRSKLS